MRKIAALLFGALVLASCATSIPNPVTGVDIYRVKTVYAATLELAVKYREVCWSRSYAQLMATPGLAQACRNRREVVRRIQSADSKAVVAISAADRFVQQNPTLSSASVVSAAWIAVQAFQSAVPAVTSR